MTPYLHQTQNRIRVRSDFITRYPEIVGAQLEMLRQMAGVQDIVYRRYAGSVAIRFDSKVLPSTQLLQQIEQLSWLAIQKDREWIDGSIRQYSKVVAKGLALMAINAVVKAPLLKTVSALVR